jgi:muramoyltetrapeptide carboxypeptidase
VFGYYDLCLCYYYKLLVCNDTATPEIYTLALHASLPSLDDCVLIIEDLDEYHYHLDRMLLALRRRGAFNNLRAVVLGEFSDIHDHDILWGPDVRHSLRKHFEAEGVPVYEHAIIGHGKENWPIILRKV